MATRTAVVCQEGGCAMATVRRSAAGGRELVACHSVDGDTAAQRSAIDGWLAAERDSLGVVGSVLDPADYQLLLVEAPDVLPAELRAAVRWRLKDNIDFPVEDAVVDVFDIPEQTRRVGSKMMYTIAAKRQAVEAHAALFRAARGFSVIDIPEMALRNLMSRLPEAEHGLILLWMSAESARLLVIKQSTLYLTRHVQFTRNGGGDGGFGNGAAAGGVDVAAIALELQRSMDYFESHYEQATIDHLIVAPVDAGTAQLVAALAGETSLHIQELDVGRALDVAPGQPPPDGRSVLAIGAALREEQKKL